MMCRTMMIPVVTGLAALVPGLAAACGLALSLAVDVSSSVDDREFDLLRGGLARALISPAVIDAVDMLPQGAMALHVFQWSGRNNAHVVLDWTRIGSAADLTRAAETIAAAPRSTKEFPTALGHALGHAVTMFRNAPPCARQVIDVSGDGRNNEGFAPKIAYRHFPIDNITVNGLAIGGEDPGITAYYLSEVIRGPGAFVETADDYGDFERAMRRKLQLEIGSMHVSAIDGTLAESD